MNIFLVTNSFQEMNFTKFLNMLFYHIYLYFMKADSGNKPLAKFTTWMIFTLIFGIIVYFGYKTVRLSVDVSADVGESKGIYILMYVVIGILVGITVFYKGFDSFDSFRDYNVKYYFYFFILCILAFAVAFNAVSINQKRILENEKMKKEYIDLQTPS